MVQYFVSFKLNLFLVLSDLASDKLISYKVIKVYNEALLVKSFWESVSIFNSPSENVEYSQLDTAYMNLIQDMIQERFCVIIFALLIKDLVVIPSTKNTGLELIQG